MDITHIAHTHAGIFTYLARETRNTTRHFGIIVAFPPPTYDSIAYDTSIVPATNRRS